MLWPTGLTEMALRNFRVILNTKYHKCMRYPRSFFCFVLFFQHCLCLTLDLLQSCEVLLAPLFGRAHALEVGYHRLRAESAIFEAG